MNHKTRRQQAQQVRENAAELAASRPHPRHYNNAEELRYRRDRDESKDEPSYIANFTKGLPHNTNTGLLLNPLDYRQFILGIQSGNSRDIQAIPLGPAQVPPPPPPECLTPAVDCDNPAKWQSGIAAEAEKRAKKPVRVRGWESQAAGLHFDLEGPDAQSVTMPPAPTLASDELVAEMAEVYLMALLRDMHFSQLRNSCSPDDERHPPPFPCGEKCDDYKSIEIDDAIKLLEKLEWFKKECCDLSDNERKRHRSLQNLERQKVFRGITPGDDKGPYLSQFLLLGHKGINEFDNIRDQSKGKIHYGAIKICQKVRVAKPCKDYMTTFESWLDVQNGADLRGHEDYLNDPPYRFITTPRDLATYVHYDALYEAYLNACLILLGMKAPFDPGLPFQGPDEHDKQQGFVSFGGPHILTLVTEVATRALKAVRYQKFNVHRRARPEAIAGLIDRYQEGISVNELSPLKDIAKGLDDIELLKLVKQHNLCQNRCSDRAGDASAGNPSYFLPMAFPEGSPMHPSYGAGHATVAGACVTILKAFFDHGWPLRDKAKNIAYEPDANGAGLNLVNVPEPLTVEGELNKLASNISIGRNWAGVHYFTDYIESLRMGEQIALGILEEQKLCYGENFAMTVPLFDGGAIQI